MIVLDTNIISEMMAAHPEVAVINWLNDQNAVTLFVSTITIAEISYGLRLLPKGQRHRLLQDRFERFIEQAFEQRILNFDEAAARVYGEVMGYRKEIGRPLSVPDGQIASIARMHGFAVATRNIKDFKDCGVEVINPFVYASKKK